MLWMPGWVIWPFHNQEPWPRRLLAARASVKTTSRRCGRNGWALSWRGGGPRRSSPPARVIPEMGLVRVREATHRRHRSGNPRYHLLAKGSNIMLSRRGGCYDASVSLSTHCSACRESPRATARHPGIHENADHTVGIAAGYAAGILTLRIRIPEKATPGKIEITRR